jgi:mono/diheme cytochrome c family protein
VALGLSLSACNVSAPTLDQIRDSKLLDRRIKETPRQKVIRECRQEGERFRVSCDACHTTNKADDIQRPDKLLLTKVGERARIMRTSPSFGLNQDCSNCHQSKFKLNRSAERLFGPGGTKYGDAQKVLKPDL